MRQATIAVIDALRHSEPLMPAQELAEQLSIAREAWLSCGPDRSNDDVRRAVRQALEDRRLDKAATSLDDAIAMLDSTGWDELRDDLLYLTEYREIDGLVTAYTAMAMRRFEEEQACAAQENIAAAEPSDWFWQDTPGIWLRFVDGEWHEQVRHVNGHTEALNRDRTTWVPFQ